MTNSSKTTERAITPLEVVLRMKEKYKYQWHNETNEYFVLRLVQEVGELASAQVHDHEHDSLHELAQIASICLNLMERMEDDIRDMGNDPTVHYDELLNR